MPERGLAPEVLKSQPEKEAVQTEKTAKASAEPGSQPEKEAVQTEKTAKASAEPVPPRQPRAHA